MTQGQITEYLDNKIKENESYIVITYFDLIVRHNLSIKDSSIFLKLAKTRLKNLGYNVYFTGESYTYSNTQKIVQDNELMVAIKI